MASLFEVILYSAIGGVFSLIGGFLLLRNRKSANLLATYATPFAGGALLAAVFLDLLKEGVAHNNADSVLVATMLGIVFFFLAEGVFRWFHHHHEHENKLENPSSILVIVGDSLHNLLDGVAIGAAFLIGAPTGIVTTIAVAAHEIPQEIGDFGLLLSKGLRRKTVLLVNLLSALLTVAGAVIVFMIGSEERLPLGVLLGLSAGFLLYIAVSDIIPAIHARNGSAKKFNRQALLFILGLLTVYSVTTIAHQYIDGHSDDHGPETSDHVKEEEHHNE
jgi:zinc and cadmium transporter